MVIADDEWVILCHIILHGFEKRLQNHYNNDRQVYLISTKEPYP